MICTAKTIITNVIGVLQLVTSALKLLASIMYGSPAAPGAPGVDSTAAGVCQVEEGVSEVYGGTVKGIMNFLDAVCSIINCASGGKPGLEGILGGGATGLPFCKGDGGGVFGTDITRFAQESGATIWPPVKDSLILSLMCLCLPGIIYNLEKKRQIDCFKAVCLYDMVKTNGYPINFCEEMHGYMTCMFVMGEIFALIPFVNFFDKLIDMVVTWISDPVALFTQAIGGICETACPTPDSPYSYILCSLWKTTSVIMEAIAAVKQMTDKEAEFGKPPGTQYCERMEEIKDEMEAES